MKCGSDRNKAAGTLYKFNTDSKSGHVVRMPEIISDHQFLKSYSYHFHHTFSQFHLFTFCLGRLTVFNCFYSELLEVEVKNILF